MMVSLMSITNMSAARRRHSALAALVAGAFAGASLLPAQPAQAQPEQAQARCLVLGPLAMSAYLDFLAQVASGAAADAAARAGNTADLIALYERLGCPMPPLSDAVECVSAALTAGPVEQAVATLAETCMAEAGLPTR